MRATGTSASSSLSLNADNGDLVSLTAVPDSGYSFSGWSLSGSSTLSSSTAMTTTLTVEGADARVSASFVNVKGYLYLANSADNTVSAFRIGPSGALVSIGAYPAGSQPLHAAASGNYLYVTNYGSNTISAYSIGSDGSLARDGTLTAIGSYSTGTKPLWLAIDGNYAYVANSVDNTVGLFGIAPDGSLSAITSYPTGSGSIPAYLAASGSFLYVADKGVNGISAYSIGSGGSLSSVETDIMSSTGSAPLSMAVNDGFLFVTNTGDKALYEYSINPTTGALLQAASDARSSAPLYLATNGSYVYLTLYDYGIAIYPLSSGVMSSPSIFTTAFRPSNLAICGSYMYVVDMADDELWAYSIASDGSLSSIGTYPTGSSPRSLAIVLK